MGLTFKAPINSFDIGVKEDICVECTRGLSPVDKLEHAGQLTGKRIYKNSGIHNERICICTDCLKKITKEL